MSILSWLVDNALNFSLHLAVAFAALYLVLRLAHRRRLAWACLGAAALALLPYLASLPRTASLTACPGAERLRVVTFNVLHSNRHPDRVMAGLLALEPDVLILQETGRRWRDHFPDVREVLPHHRRAGYASVDIFSRTPFFDSADSQPAGAVGRTVYGRILFDDAPLGLAAVHATKPSSPGNLRRRGREFADLASALGPEARDGALIVAGDFNASPLSPAFQRFLGEAHLKRPRSTALIRSWPAGRTLLGLQIDHVLASDALVFTMLETGPELGSNHLPVIAELSRVAVCGQ